MRFRTAPAGCARVRTTDTLEIGDLRLFTALCRHARSLQLADRERLRPTSTRSRQPGQRQPPPAGEAFFSTALPLSLAAILVQYRERWAVEITRRESNAFTGFGQDQCRKSERVVGAHTLRLGLAAARPLGLVAQASRPPALDLTRYRPG